MSRSNVEFSAISAVPGRSAPISTPRRNAPFDQQPGFYEPAGLWLYGNIRLLNGSLCGVDAACGPPKHMPKELDDIEQTVERFVLEGKVLVTGIHSPAHMRAAIVPLRWGAPRILVLSGGFQHHLGQNLTEEPFRAARLWRYQWDAKTDLVISRRAPDKLPTFAQHNPTVDRLIGKVANKELKGCLFGNPEF